MIRPCYVLWDDAAGPDGWVDSANVHAKEADRLITTVALLLHETPDAITVTPHRGGDQCHAPVTIPRSAIRKFFEFDLP